MVERVLILKGADLLREVGPRHLLKLAEVAREIELWKGDTIYEENDPSDALYIVVEGRVRLTLRGQPASEVGPGEAFGTWALVDALFAHELALEARDALAAVGDAAIQPLRRLLAGSRGAAGQSVAARALAHIATPRAIRTLAPLARSTDLRLRQLGLQSLSRARVRAGRPILPRGVAHRMFLRELRDYRREREPGIALGGSELP